MREFSSPFNDVCSWNKQFMDPALSHCSESFVLREMDATQPQLPSTVRLRSCVSATRGLQLETAATHYSGCILVLAEIYSHMLQAN